MWKRKKEKIILYLITAAFLITYKIYDVSTNKSNNTSIQTNSINDAKTYSKELARFFPLKDSGTLYYLGTNKYNEKLDLYKITGTKKEIIVNYKGKVLIPLGNKDSKNCKHEFVKEYTITNNSIKMLKKYDYNAVNDIKLIEEQTVIKFPICIGNTWREEVKFKGEKRNSYSRILDVYYSKDLKKMIKVETSINEVKGYPNDIYKEIKVYKEDKGLVEFYNTVFLEDASKEGTFNSLQFNCKLCEKDK